MQWSRKFGQWLPQMEWINFGGGHHITREDYDIPRLEACIKRMQNDYGLEVYLEAGRSCRAERGLSGDLCTGFP